MMNRPEDRKRIAGLAAALLLVLGFLGVRLMPGSARSAVAAKPAATAMPQGGPMLLGSPPASLPAPEAREAATVKSGDEAPGDAALADPFRPLPAERAAAKPQRPAAAKTAATPVTAYGPPAPQPESAATKIVLKGVILGQPSVASLEAGGKSLVAHVGDRLPNGAVIVKLLDDGAVVQLGERRATVEIGREIL